MIGIELVVTDAIAQWRPQKLITILTYPLNACTDQQKTINFGATAWRLQIVAVNTTMTKDAFGANVCYRWQKYRNEVFLLSVLLPRTGGTMNLLTTSSKQLP